MMNSKKLTGGLLVFYLLALTWIILLKLSFSFQELDRFRSINLIPFGASFDMAEIRDNILVFLPFGVLLYALWQRKSFLKMAAPIFFTSLLYEAGQYAFAIGRSDITDLIGNTLGGIIGILISFLLFQLWGEKTRRIINIIAFIGSVLFSLLIALLLLANLQ